jgi:hypothetical protein
MAKKDEARFPAQSPEELDFKRIRDSDEDIHALYQLLQLRENNISHVAMPSLAEHYKFVKNHPYRFWYLIKKKKTPIGSVYFHFDNSIGVSIPKQSSSLVAAALRRAVSLHHPLRAKKSVRSDHFYINSSPENQQLRQASRLIGWKVLQVSYAAPKDTKTEGL